MQGLSGFYKYTAQDGSEVITKWDVSPEGAWTQIHDFDQQPQQPQQDEAVAQPLAQEQTEAAQANRLPLALTGAARAVAVDRLVEEKAHAAGLDDALLHREALLVVAAGNAEDVALVLLGDIVTGDLLSHALLVEHAAATAERGTAACQ